MVNRWTELHGILNRLILFVDGTDVSMKLAGELEVALDNAFPDDSRFEDLVLTLASYQPGGGPYLYDERAIAKLCQQVIPIVQSELTRCAK